MTGLVYFIQNVQTGNIKIGKSNSENIFSRFQTLRCATEHDLKIIGIILGKNIDFESKLHNKFIKDKIKNEWFKASDKLLEYIKTKSISLEEFKIKNEELLIREEKELLRKKKFEEMKTTINRFCNNYYENCKDDPRYFYHALLKISSMAFYNKLNEYYGYSSDEIAEFLKRNPKDYKLKRLKHHDEFTCEFKVSNFILAMKYEQFK